MTAVDGANDKWGGHVVRRPDGSPVAAFGAGRGDPFEVEAAVWEDAD